MAGTRPIFLILMTTWAMTLGVVEFFSKNLSAATFSDVMVKQSVAGYSDNAGLTRSKIGLDAANPSLRFGVAREIVSEANWLDNKYLRTIYGEGVRINDSWNLGVTQTFGKLTDIRAAIGGASDGVIRSQNIGVGISQWTIHETLQVGLDLSHSAVDRPEYEILDFDATVLTAPPQVTSNGGTFAVRHLATPTTIPLASVTLTKSSDRPLAQFYLVGVRQYVPAFGGAFHGSLYRGLNQGSLSTKTLYGEVNSWAADLAWIQEFSAATQLRLGWRTYKELEIGRAYGDQTQFGSDLLSVGMVHNLKAEFTAGHKVTVEAVVVKYLTNRDLMATTANLGLSEKF